MSTTSEPNIHSAARQAVAAEIRALMGRHRVSQTMLAGHLGISQPSLSRRLLSELPFDMDELLSVAAYFNVQVTDLFIGVVQGKSSLPWMTIEPADEGFLTVVPCRDQLSLDHLLTAAA